MRAKILVAPDGVSQHSQKFKDVIGYKTNANGEREPVYFAVAACTPLAIAFAATAAAANRAKRYAGESTPGEHLDAILGDKARVAKGINELQKIFKTNPGITPESPNLGGEEGLRVYNAMSDKPTVVKKIYSGAGNDYVCYDDMTPKREEGWHHKILKNLDKGEGALVIFGGYSIGVRRIEDSYEIFEMAQFTALFQPIRRLRDSLS